MEFVEINAGRFYSLPIVGSNKGPKYIKTDPKLLQLLIYSQNYK